MNRARMNQRVAIWAVIVLVVLLLTPTTPVAAKGSDPDEGITVFNEDFTLSSGETLDGDLIVINGSLTLESGSRVKGSVFVWSGDAEVEGTVEADLVVTQGDIYLEDDATVEGNVVCGWNCDLERAEGALVEGDVVFGAPIPLPKITSPQAPALEPQAPAGFWELGVGPWLSWFLRVVQAFAAMVVLAVVAGIVAAILPDRTTRVGRTVLSAPIQSGGIGILTTVAAGVLIAVLAITICFSPVAILVALVLGVASLFGWISIGALLGERLLRSEDGQNRSLAWKAALGTLLISMLTMFVGAVGVRCLGFIAWVASVVAGFVGLGAVVLSRFGGAVYAPGATARGPGEMTADEAIVHADAVEREMLTGDSGLPPDERPVDDGFQGP